VADGKEKGKGKGYRFRQYNSVPHPFRLPGFTDAFSFAAPALMFHLTSFLTELIGRRQGQDHDEGKTKSSSSSLFPEELRIEGEDDNDDDIEAKVTIFRVALARHEQLATLSAQRRAVLLGGNPPSMNMAAFGRAVAFGSNRNSNNNNNNNEEGPAHQRHPSMELKKAISMTW
jgi:hypothetical protein